MTGKLSSPGTARNRHAAPDGLIGLLQFTTAVRAGHANHADPVLDSHGLSAVTLRAIAHTIRGLFETPDFGAHGLAQVPGRAPGWVPDPPSHSWLGTRSRHIAVRLPNYFYDSREPIPKCLDFGAGNPRPGPESFPPWISYKRLQAAADPSNEAQKGTSDGTASRPYIDATDYVIRACPPAAGESLARVEQRPSQVGRADLEEAQLFLAELWAQRKADVFASRLSERIYHVWLPPGNLQPTPGHELIALCGLGTLGVFPVVTFVRRPGESVFRRTIALSIVLVPLHDLASSEGRAFGVEEVSTLLQMISEPSTQVHNRAAATVVYSLGGPLLDYLDQAGTCHVEQRPLTADMVAREWPHKGELAPGPGQLSSHSPTPVGTLRQWAELIVTAAAERGIAPGDNPWHSPRELADEVLASLRLSSTWLVSVLHDKIQPTPEWADEPNGGGPGINAQPAQLSGLLDQLARRTLTGKRRHARSPGRFPVELFTRIDQRQTLDSNAVAWHVPGRRGIVLAYQRGAEQFPGRSSLNSFGAFGHMLIAASCSIDMIEALLQEAVWQPDTLHRARSAYDLLVELEDLVDLDTAWPSYRAMWRQYLQALGLDDRYRMVLERVQLLARYADVKERQQGLADRDRERRFEAMITLLATAFGLGVLVLSDAVLFAASAKVHAWTIIVTLAVAALTVVTVVMRERLVNAYLRHERRKI